MKFLVLALPILLLLSCNDKETPAPDTKTETKSWNLLNPQVFELADSSLTRIQLDLKTNALWYHESEAGLMYTEIKGDFTIEAVVKARKRSDNDQSVTCGVCLGGLMARSPGITSGQNYVHIVSGNTPVGLGVETKRTENSVSTYEPVNNGSSDSELKLQRVGNQFLLFSRSLGASEWVEAATYQHDGLPETLQVGINIYTAQNGPTVGDLSVIYENILLTQ